MRDIGKNIRALRIQKKMTQDQLAERLCITRQTVSNYETGRSRPDIDTLLRISEALQTDIHQVIYGVPIPGRKAEWIRVWVCVALAVLFCISWYALIPVAKQLQTQYLDPSLRYFMYLAIRPMIYLCIGYMLAQLACMALRRKPFATGWSAAIASILLIWLVGSLIFVIWDSGAVMLESWLSRQKIGGTWAVGENGLMQYERLQLERPPLWASNLFILLSYRPLLDYYLIAMPPLGAALCLFRFPKRKKHKASEAAPADPSASEA